MNSTTFTSSGVRRSMNLLIGISLPQKERMNQDRVATMGISRQVAVSNTHVQESKRGHYRRGHARGLSGGWWKDSAKQPVVKYSSVVHAISVV